jgi:hypothetical protein
MIVAELVTKSYGMAQIVARGLDSTQSHQGKDGLFFLNLLLSEKSVPASYIPYYTEYTLDTVSGQETYFVPMLAKISAISFEMDSIRYGLQPQNVGQYKGSSRANNIKSLPYSYWARRVNGGLNISLYYLPNQVYQVDITGKFVPEKVTMDDELDDKFDSFYQFYLMYDLANRLCQFNGISLPLSVEVQLSKYESTMKNINEMDTDCKISTVISGQGGINYAAANIGRGWVPVQ